MNTRLIIDIVYLILVAVAFSLVYWRCVWLAHRAALYWERSEVYRISGETLEDEITRLMKKLKWAEDGLKATQEATLDNEFMTLEEWRVDEPPL